MPHAYYSPSSLIAIEVFSKAVILTILLFRSIGTNSLENFNSFFYPNYPKELSPIANTWLFSVNTKIWLFPEVNYIILADLISVSSYVW